MLNLLMMMHIVARFPRSTSNIITTNMTSYNNSTVKFIFQQLVPVVPVAARFNIPGGGEADVELVETSLRLERDGGWRWW